MSQTSLGMGSGLDDDHGSGIQVSRLVPEGSNSLSEPFYDYVAYVIFCSQHQKVALSKAMKNDDIRALWMPYVALPADKKWTDATKEGIDLVLNKFESQMGYHRGGSQEAQLKIPIRVSKCIKIYRLQIPGTLKFITRLIHLVVLDSNANCCDSNKSFFWCPLNDILSDRVGKLWGPEVKEYVTSCKEQNPKGRNVGEYALDSAYKNLKTKVIQSAKISDTNVDTIYSSFLDFCFPSFFMNFHTFREYLAKYDYQSDTTSLKMLFKAFDTERNGYLKFNDFVFGLACWEPNSAHEESRIKFVFRYYDTDGDDFLSQPEFKRLVKDIAPKESDDEIQQRITEGFNQFGAMNRISQELFVKKVLESRFKKTETLCRCQHPFVKKIFDLMSSFSQLRLKLVKEDTVKAKRRAKGVCNQCKAKDFDFHHYGIFFETSGQRGSPFPIAPNPRDNDHEHLYASEFIFGDPNLATILIELLQEFNAKKGQSEDYRGFLCEPKDRIGFVNYLQQFSVTLNHIFAAEERIVRINSPAYIIGDIVGNLNDLLAMEKILWRGHPILATNYVFLGNYVETGKWGIECVLYLFCLKVMSPNKVFLLRGRNEVRQTQSTFQKECIDKYEQKYGKIIWEIINNLFDKMPIALTIDETIFCTNSGITNTKTKAKDFKKFSSTIKDPINESEDTMQILFNEPIEKIPKTLNPRYGFAKNPNKEYGYVFDESALKSFLQRNDLTRVIAGNKPTSDGYKFLFGGKFITIFSSSRFKNLNNKCAALLVFKKKIRVIQMDTPDNSNKNNDEDTKTIAKFTK